MNKIVYIFRAIPGAGKSTIAEHITGLCAMARKSFTVCCADDYFMVDGKYMWDAEKIGNAHAWCKGKFLDAVETGVDTIIVANTNTTARDVRHYRNLAVDHKYTVFVMTIENWHGGTDVHNVPDDIKLSMADSLKNSMCLFNVPTVIIDGVEMPVYKLNSETNKYEKIEY
jgi:hypothetical protein